MLKAEHITKQYQIPGGRHTVFDAVSDVSIELGNGGVTAIVGESGSGKSTLARVLSYVERPDGGRVFLDGLEVSACGRRELRAVRGKVQLVMQNALGSLDPHQSVESILEEPLRLLFHMPLLSSIWEPQLLFQRWTGTAKCSAVPFCRACASLWRR